MSLDASTLQVIVKGDGITSTTDALNKLASAGDKAERSTAKLAKAGKTADATAQAQAKVWYDLVDKVSKAKEREYNALQRHNNRVYANIQAEANKLNRLYDRQHAQDAANFAKRRAQEQSQLEDLDTMRHKAASKEYARAQAEATRMNALLDRQRKQQEAAAKASAERQRVLNSNYAASSLAQQIATLQRAQQYSAQGGNVGQRFGSTVAGASTSGELTRLQQQYKQLGEEAKRTNSIMSDAHAAVRGLSGSLGALWMTYGSLLPLLAGAAIGAGLREAVTGFAAVEYQMTFTKSLTEDTTNSVKQLTASLHEVAMGLGINPEQAAKGLRALAQAGLDTKQAMESLATVFKVATVGELPLDTAALALTGVMNAYGLVVRDLEHVGDVMVKAGAMSATSVSAMSESMKYAAGTAEQYGVSLEKLGTILTLLGKRTITGSSAGVAANNLIAEIYSPSSEKAIKAQAALGVKAYVNGVRQELNVAMASIKEGLAKFDAESQGKLLEDMFGKKGGRGFYAVAQADQKEFLEMEEKLRESTGFTAKVYADTMQTVQGQAQLTSAAIANTFATIGEGTAEPIKDFLRTVREAFQSDALKDALVGFTQSIATIAKTIGPVTIAVGALWAAMKVGGIVIPLVVKAMAMLNVTAITTGFYAAASAVMKFGQALAAGNLLLAATNPIGIALIGTITLLAGAYLLFKRNKESALDLHAKEMKNGADTLEMLDKENKLLERKLELQRKGISEAGMESALRKIEGEDAAEVIRAEMAANANRIKALSGEGTRRSEGSELARQTEINRLTNANQSLNKALAERLTLNEKIEASDKRRAAMMAQYREQERINRDSEMYAEMGQGTGPGGTGTYGGNKDAESAAKKIENAAKAEYRELEKLTAGYDAKTKALMEYYRTGEKVASDSRQAIVEANLQMGVYGSKEKDNALYLRNLAKAKAADEAKFREEKAKSFVELTSNMQQIIDGEMAFQKAAKDSGAAKMGTYERQIEAAGKILNMSDAEIAKAREMAKASDEINRVLAARQKLETAVASTTSRAEAALDEAQAMLQYGEATKISAMQVAELLIKKLQLNDAGSESMKSMLREAAATEQLNVAYRELAKQQVELNKELQDAQAESLIIFADSEAEKIRIAAESQKKLAAIRLQEASDAAMKTGDLAQLENVYYTYANNVAKIDETVTVKTNNLKLKEWKKTIDDIEQIAREGFYNLSEKGVNIWSSMARTFKNMFKTTVMDYIYKEFAKPIMLKVIASIAGAVGADGLSSAAKAMGGGGDSAPITSAVTKLYDIFKSGGSFSQSVTGFVDYLSGPGVIGAEAAPSAFATGVGTVAGYAAGALGGHYIGRAISGGYSVSGSGNGLVNAGTAVGAIVGGPIGAAIGGAIAGGINRLFGMKQKEITKTGISGAIEGDGKVSGQAYSMWEQKGGVFRSDKSGIEAKGLDAAIVNSFTAGMAELKAASASFAKELGVSADILIGYGKHFDIAFTDDAAANQEAVAKLFTDISDEMATKLIPNIMEFAKQGESAGAVLERLSNVFAATNNVANILGKSVEQVFGSAGLESSAARNKLVDMSGGSDALNQKAAGYVNAIYTDAQKLEPVQRALTEAMSKLGLASVTTKEQFKGVVDGLNLTKDADIQLFNSLMELAPAFGEITAASEAAAKAEKDRVNEVLNKRLELEGRIAELTGNTAEAMRVLQAQRKIELEALDVTLRPLQERAWALEDEAKAQEKAKGILSTRLDLEARMAELTGNAVQAAHILNVQRQIELETMDASLRPHQQYVWMLEDQASATEKARDNFKSRIDLEMQMATLTENSAMAAHLLNVQREIELSKMDESLKPHQKYVWLLEDEKKARDKAAEIMSAKLGIEATIADLTKDTAMASRVLADQRAIELSKIDESLRPLQQRAWMLEDEAKASEKVKAVINSRLNIEANIAELTNDTAAASSVLAIQRAIELSAMDESLRPLQARLWLLEDEHKLNEKVKAITSSRLSLQANFAELTQNEALATQVLAAQRAIELVGMDESLRPLQQRVWLLEDEKKAMDKAIEAAETAYSRLETSVSKEKETVTKFYDAAIEAVNKKAEIEKETAQKQLEQVEKQRDAIKAVFDSLSNAMQSTEVESAAMTKARRMEAQAYLQMAAIQASSGGDITKLSGLNGALEAISKPSEDLFSTFEDYARDQAQTANVISNLQGTAANQLSYAELTIERMNATIEAIDVAAKANITALEVARDAELSSLDKILENAKAQIDALKGIDNSVLSVADALAQFASAVMAANKAKDSFASAGGMPMPSAPAPSVPSVPSVPTSVPVDPNKGAIEHMYQLWLGRPADQAGMDFWTNAIGKGSTLTDVASSIINSKEYRDKLGLPSFAVGTNFVPEDMVAQIHKGERIVPAADNAAITRSLSEGGNSSDIGELKAAFNELKQVIISGDVAKIQIMKEHLRLEKKWDQEGQPEVRDTSDYAA